MNIFIAQTLLEKHLTSSTLQSILLLYKMATPPLNLPLVIDPHC